MLRIYLYSLFLSLILIHSPIYSQTLRDNNSRLIAKFLNGEIRNHSAKKIGSISSDGVVRNGSSKKLGNILEGKVLNEYSQTIFRYDDSGTVRDKNNKIIYRIRNGEVRNSSGKLMLKYQGITTSYIVGYLCFFYI